MADREVVVKLKVDPDKSNKVEEAFAEAVAELEKQQSAIDAINDGLDPILVKEKARLEIAKELAKQQAKAAVEAEKEKIAPTAQAVPETPRQRATKELDQELRKQTDRRAVDAEKEKQAPTAKGAGFFDQLKADMSGILQGNMPKGKDSAAGAIIGAAGAGGIGAGLQAGIGAVLGPEGALAMEALQAVASGVKAVASAPGKAVAGALNAVSGALGELGGSLGPIGSILGAVQGVGSGLKSAGDALGPFGIGLSVVGGTMDAVTGALREFTEVIVTLASAANPAAAKRWQYAIMDVQAEVGFRFVPLLDRLTEVVKTIGDFLANILPDTREVDGALGGFDDALADVRDALMGIAPLINDVLVVALEQVGFAARLAAANFKTLMGSLQFFLPFLNIAPGAANKTDLGAAPGHASVGSDIDDIARQVEAAALMAGRGVEKKPEETTAENTKTMVELLGKLIDLFGDKGEGRQIAEAGEGIGEGIAAGVKNAVFGFP